MGLYGGKSEKLERRNCHGKRKSIIREGVDILLSMAAFGESKYADKKANFGKPALNRIYSSRTMDIYVDVAARYLKWARNEHNCRTVEDAQKHVAQYLEMRIASMSSWTVHLEASALAKLYQCHMNEFGVVLPVRRRADIRQHRQQKWVGHYCPENHLDLEAFSHATGLRRHELAQVTTDDVWEHDSRVYVRVSSGKGGKQRIVPALDSAPLTIAQKAKDEGKYLIFENKIPKYYPAHEYRARYAKTLYQRLARNVENLQHDEKYICRRDMAGQVFDKQAMMVVSNALGHSRLSVIASHYLYNMD